MLRRKVDEKENLAPFLKSLFIFAKLSDDTIARLLEDFEVLNLAEGERVYTEGVDNPYFFIVWDGKIRLSTGRGKQKQEWDTLTVGDYFGEDFLLGPVRAETAYALTPSRLLRLEQARFLALRQEDPNVETLVRATAEGRRLYRRERMKWLSEDETIYIVVRRHEFFLMVTLLLPIFLGVATVPLMVVSFASGSLPLIIFSMLLALFTGGLAVWLWEDWRNDYFAVTNRRVLWLEKVILIYDSLQVAPLNTILSTNITFNQVLHAIIDYGTVIVRTYTGSIVKRRAARPHLVVAFIEGLQARAREQARRVEAAKMEELIRERLNLPPEKRPVPSPPEAKPVPPPPLLMSPWQRLFSNFFKLRFEVGETITYRKHWIILMQKTLLPTLAMVAIFAVLFFSGQLFPDIALLTPGFLIFFWIPLIVGIFLWWLYHYIDWRNDIYVVTLESIFDIERKPLSREVKKSAQLANILSLEHSRIGLLALLLNYGTVIINIGVEQFTFYYVYRPAQVQYEIFDRIYAQRQRKEEAQANQERERIINWLATYHREVESLEEEKESDLDPFSG